LLRDMDDAVAALDQAGVQNCGVPCDHSHLARLGADPDADLRRHRPRERRG
jgi:sugar phosphate isomerase/epimerase